MASTDKPAPAQPRNPLHGLTLEAIVTALVAHYGWAGLAELIALRCFSVKPSMASSLKVLRKTPWARDKVESLYLFMLREQRRKGSAASSASLSKPLSLPQSSSQSQAPRSPLATALPSPGTPDAV